MFSRSALFSVFTLSLAIAFVFPHVFVAAQTSPDSNERPGDEVRPTRRSIPASRRRGSDETEQIKDKRVEEIRNQIFQSQQVKTMCQNYFNKIGFELTGDKLRILTGNNLCAHTITQEVLQPQLSNGKIRTYEYTGDREDLIVTLVERSSELR